MIVVICLLGIKLIWIKSADTSWIDDFGYRNNEIYNLKLDKAGLPLIPVIIGEKNCYFNFDTGCSVDIVITNMLENRIEYSNIICSMVDWKMSSSYQYTGLIGTALFNDMIITLDYRAHKMGISNHVDYNIIDSEKYLIIPILQTQSEGQENLLFFECKMNGETIIAYIDTGKNISYSHNPKSQYKIGESNKKPNTDMRSVNIDINNMLIKLDDVYEANMPQNYDFDYPVAIEINSDQFIKNDMVVTFDFINNYIIFYKR